MGIKRVDELPAQGVVPAEALIPVEVAGVLSKVTADHFLQGDGVPTNIAIFDADGNITDSGQTVAEVIQDAIDGVPPGTGGDVVGPSGAVEGNFASYDGITGKLIEDSGVSVADFTNRVHVYSCGGSGSDGPLTASAGVTTLTKATYYSTVTLTGTAQIDTAGWPLFIQVFDASNAPARAIYAKGTDTVATSPNPGAQLAPNAGSHLGGNGAGGQAPSAGGNPNINGSAGDAGATIPTAGGGIGGAGGTGGNGNGGKTGGGGGAGGTITLRVYSQGPNPIGPVYTASGGGGIFQPILGGSGGGGGGSGAGGTVNPGAAGVAGGGGGRVLELNISELMTSASTPAALIDSYGGASAAPNGTPSGGGAGASGGGGGGGICRVTIGKRTGAAVTNIICANGADGGTSGAANGGGTAGVGGQAGGGGEVSVRVLSTGANYYKAYEVGGGPAASGATGGVHTTWGVTL